MPAHRRAIGVAILASLVVLALLGPPAATAAAKGERVISGQVPLAGMNVVLRAANPGSPRPEVLGTARSRRGGEFTIRYRRSSARTVKYLVATRPGGAAEAGFPAPASAYRLGAALGAGAVPGRATVNERTTVAMAYAMAQFIRGARVAGKNPGLRNAAAMTRNLVGRRGGGLSPVLDRFPNGRSTSTRATFDSLANLLALCRRQGRRCARLLTLGGAPGGDAAGDTLQATATIARNPWHNADRLFALSRSAPQLYGPALAAGERPDAWTLALRFEGDGESIDGPGNFAIDAGGNLWVGNNYEYNRDPREPACGSEKLLRFTPTGENYPGSPYTGGGLSGVGFGVTIDPSDHVWVGNFGFKGSGCTKTPPSNSVSEFTLSGEPLSPDLMEIPAGSNLFKGGFEQGSISWPQGTVSDRSGNIWIANCGNNSVTQYPQGNPEAARNFSESQIGLRRPFGVAVNGEGIAFVTGNESATVAMLGPDGTPVRAPISGGGLHRPLGIAGDSRGYMWVSNSTWVVAPCSGEFHPQGGPRQGGSLTLIEPDGDLVRSRAFEGGGVVNPWGVAIDGDDNVWVANFSGQRLTELCGTRPRNCPPGKRRLGASISPAKTGYGFDGLVRNTGVAVDPSGNVWLANNWKTKAIQTNPGGYQIVAFLGLAAPVKAPLIGPPEQP